MGPSSLPSSFRSDLEDILRVHIATLYRPGLGRRLIERFGSPGNVWRQSRRELREFPGVTPEILERLFDSRSAARAREEIRKAREAGIRIVSAADPAYPTALKELPGMPLVLYVRGAWWLILEHLPCDGKPRPSAAVALVGSRRPTQYGLRQARAFSGELSRRGFTIVSGLALGIDGEAHRSCLEAGGHTVAVVGCGLDRTYPPDHEALVRRMVESGRGALVGEFPFGSPPRAFHFPLRNRVLSGLCQAVVVVEAGVRSGSLVTARHAVDQGKTVYAVPGRISSEALGGLRLLADGATPALSADDVLPGQGELPGGRVAGAESTGGSPQGTCGARLDGPYAAALELLFREEDTWHADAIAERLGAPAGAILAELSRLELEGTIERLPGGAYALRQGRA